MSLYYLPVIVMAGITFYVGVFHLFIYFRQTQRREHLTFALTCMAMGLYDVFSVGLYSATSAQAGLPWQRLQVATLAFVSITFPWFIMDYFSHTPLISPRMRRWVGVWSGYFVLAAIAGLADRSGLYWPPDQPAIKVIELPWGPQITYYEMAPGPLVHLQSVMGLALFACFLWVTIRVYRSGYQREARPLLYGMGLFFLSVISDTAVSNGLYPFVYTIEYAYMGIVLLMTYTLAGQVVKAAVMEEALRESEIKHRLLLASIRSPVLALSEDMTILYCNEAYAAFVGRPAEELQGSNLLDMFPYLQETRTIATYRKVLRTQEADQVEGWVKDIYLQAWVYPTPWGILAIAEDVTERRRLREQLRQAQKMEAIGTLAGGIAHDFNNILTGILGNASLLYQDLPVHSPLREDAAAIVNSARRAADLTHQLLTFARRSQRVKMEPLRLNGVVQEVVRLLERTIDKAISIEVYLDDDLALVYGDSGQLHQALLNLCLNARDAMPQGGQLIIETRNVHVGEEAKVSLDIEEGDYVLLSVTDSGEGMAAAVRERIFEPFFTTKDQGRGLGLAMVYGIVRGHDGAIHVYSEPGEGTTFKVYMPVHTAPVEPAVSPERMVPGGSETVLVVDDEEEVRNVLQRILIRGGYQVLVAAGGAKAVELYRQQGEEIELVILDVVMPQLSGQQTYELLREIDPQVKVLLSSGYSANGQAANILAAGAQGFLQKPYGVATVLRQVRVVLDR